MAQVHIIFTDTDDENVNLTVEFEPPVTSESEGTPAQCEAAFMIEIMQRHAKGETLAEIAVDLDETNPPGTMVSEEWWEEDTEPGSDGAEN